MTVEVRTRGLQGLLDILDGLPENIDRASILALNDGARKAQRDGAKGIRSEVNFKARYLGSATDPNARLAVAKRARSGDAEAVVRGRERPTSLANEQFLKGSRKIGRRSERSPLRVQVKAGGAAQEMPGAWLIKLRAGKNIDPDKFNLGLAIRLKPGQRINKRILGGQIGPTAKDGSAVHLLYGPSVAQVFRDVARDIEGGVSDYLEEEFLRQFKRLNK